MKTIIVAGTNSSVGKTTITKALTLLLENPQLFKIGPDFIDPSFYRYITKKKVYNLDLFCYGSDKLRFVFDRYKSQINVIEGVMGLYAGIGNTLNNYSTAHVARVLDAKVILVVDGRKKDSSIMALVLGYLKLDERVQIQGVIINNVTSGMYKYLKEALLTIGVKTYGYLPIIEDIRIPERHLGLLQADELSEIDVQLNKLLDYSKKTIKYDEIIDDFNHNFTYDGPNYFEEINGWYKGKTVAITKDKAFSFFYDIHLDMLKESGANVIFFSPLNDPDLPAANLYFFSGGYPELYINELINNKSIRSQIIKIDTNLIAECGGYIYLSKSLVIEDEKKSLLGIFKDEIIMTSKLDISHFGYLDILTEDNFNIKGHEFHYSKLVNSYEKSNYFNVTNKKYSTGYQKQLIVGGYPHILWLSNIKYFKNIIKEN